MWATKAPRVATVHDDYQRVELGPRYPSARLPCVCLSRHTVGGPCTTLVTPLRYGRVLSNLGTDEASKFAGPKKSRMHQYTTQSMFIQTQPVRALADIGRGYHHGALNFRSGRSPSFPSSILHFLLIAPPGLQLC
jgi:hypothetical protein